MPTFKAKAKEAKYLYYIRYSFNVKNESKIQPLQNIYEQTETKCEKMLTQEPVGREEDRYRRREIGKETPRKKTWRRLDFSLSVVSQIAFQLILNFDYVSIIHQPGTIRFVK